MSQLVGHDMNGMLDSPFIVVGPRSAAFPPQIRIRGPALSLGGTSVGPMRFGSITWHSFSGVHYYLSKREPRGGRCFRRQRLRPENLQRQKGEGWGNEMGFDQGHDQMTMEVAHTELFSISSCKSSHWWCCRRRIEDRGWANRTRRLLLL